MSEFFAWFTDLGNSKTAAAVIFFTTFIAISIYVFTNKHRKKRYDHYRFIPLLDDEDLSAVTQKNAPRLDDNSNDKHQAK